MSFGAGSEKSKSKVDVWGPQKGYLQDIYRQGQDFYGQGAGINDQAINLGQTGLNQIGDMYGRTSQYFDPLAAGGQSGQINVTDPMQSYLGQTLQGQGQGMETLTNLQQGGANPYLQGMVGAATRDLTNSYTQNVLPGITNEASATGGLGGSRQGVAQGIAAQNLTNQIADTTAEMYGGAYDADQQRRLQAAQQMLAQQGQAGQLAGGLMGQGEQTGLSAMNQANQLAQLGMYPSQAAGQLYNQTWNPLQQYSNIIGAPVSGQKSKGSSMKIQAAKE